MIEEKQINKEHDKVNKLYDPIRQDSINQDSIDPDVLLWLKINQEVIDSINKPRFGIY